MEQIRFSQPIPYFAQIASRHLANEIFEEALDPRLDPNWACSGANSTEEYAYWVMRACGIACIKMCAESLGGSERSLHDWIRMGLEAEGYLTVEENGQILEKGWIHGKLANLLAETGLYAKAMQASPGEIAIHLRRGNLIIASVSYQLGTEAAITVKGGHLVVVVGMDLQEGQPVTFIIHNPSGRTPALQEYAPIPAERFLQAYTGRIILVSKCQPALGE